MRDDGWLKRRVLLTGGVTLVAFFAITAAVTSWGRSDWYAVAFLGAFLLLVTLPMLAPVREELRARRHR